MSTSLLYLGFDEGIPDVEATDADVEPHPRRVRLGHCERPE